MASSTNSITSPLREQLDRLAAFEPSALPVISLYLDMRPDEHGRDRCDAWLRKALAERTPSLQGDARASFDRDVERITAWLASERRPSANALAIFACAGAGDFFEALQLDAPVDQHWLFVGAVPHLYPLSRLDDQYARYAALLLDTNSARIFVFSLGATQRQESVQGVKTRKTAMGGWSQARYQRHTANYHLHHMKEVVGVLERVVAEEGIDRIILAADEVSRPALEAQLPQQLSSKVIDATTLDVRTPEHEVLRHTLELLQQHDSRTDAEHVAQMRDAWQGSGLGAVGPDAVFRALQLGQVEELLITASASGVKPPMAMPRDAAPAPIATATTAPPQEADPERLRVADELVTRAHQTGARVRFIEDPALLADFGGVGALLRFRLETR